jgi:hypothetical protein
MDDSCIDNSVYSSEYEGFSVEKARLYCAISLLLRYAIPVVRLIIYFSMMYLSIRASGSMMSDPTVFTSLGNLVQFVGYVISWFLMASVRRYKSDYLFGKVLKWMYIADTVLLVLFVGITTYGVVTSIAQFMK